MKYECIFRLRSEQQEDFSAFPEIYQGVQVGLIKHRNWNGVSCLVVSGLVAVVIEASLQNELQAFFSATWRPTSPATTSIIQRYENWLKQLDEPDHLVLIDAGRESVALAVSSGAPPPPPNRTSVIPRPPGPPPAPPAPPAPPPGTAVYGHLPFQSITEDREVFFRCEAWPTSRRVIAATNTVVVDTYASPHAEVPFIPTGFAAVARTALPSFFPAVFRYEIKPPAATPILCGAVVPMFGQSGGGVEVCFTSQFTNIGPIAHPIVLPPL